ncbi:hypothetical protein PoMZ_10446, partial [Pyricularia oryzae]
RVGQDRDPCHDEFKVAHFAYLESPQARPVLYEVDCYFRCRYLRTAWIMSISSKLAPSIRPTWPMGRSLYVPYEKQTQRAFAKMVQGKEVHAEARGRRGARRPPSGIDILDSENSKPIRTTLEPPNKNSAMHAAPPNPRSENAGRSMLPICVH